MAHTFTELLIHIVFSTKDRMPQITSDLRDELFAYMGGILREMNASAIIINGTTDHVHLLVKFPPSLSISEMMRVLKTNPSRWIHQTRVSYATFGWQTGYGTFSVSKSKTETVTQYTASQEEHHRKISFKEEFLGFLKMHNIEYDERYIWE